ncbi:ABC transporter F family member 4 [Drosophila subpulchrella]|uniref:ABC transporter F family member 4 n=1 Tax=Drosophila subpulchrella TaxID=1486046 RepID=UPI0018A16D95|nr:ABC transporter F family member 4 [Drosophila subpulchrella]
MPKAEKNKKQKQDPAPIEQLFSSEDDYDMNLANFQRGSKSAPTKPKPEEQHASSDDENNFNLVNIIKGTKPQKASLSESESESGEEPSDESELEPVEQDAEQFLFSDDGYDMNLANFERGSKSAPTKPKPEEQDTSSDDENKLYLPKPQKASLSESESEEEPSDESDSELKEQDAEQFLFSDDGYDMNLANFERGSKSAPTKPKPEEQDTSSDDENKLYLPKPQKASLSESESEEEPSDESDLEPVEQDAEQFLFSDDGYDMNLANFERGSKSAPTKPKPEKQDTSSDDENKLYLPKPQKASLSESESEEEPSDESDSELKEQDAEQFLFSNDGYDMNLANFKRGSKSAPTKPKPEEQDASSDDENKLYLPKPQKASLSESESEEEPSDESDSELKEQDAEQFLFSDDGYDMNLANFKRGSKSAPTKPKPEKQDTSSDDENKLYLPKPQKASLSESESEEEPSDESDSELEEQDAEQPLSSDGDYDMNLANFKNGTKSVPTKPEPKKKYDKLPVPSDDEDEMDMANFKNGSTPARTKKAKKGIIYISNIPKHMNVTRLRKILGEYGKIGRVYLQPEKLSSAKAKKNKRKGRKIRFTEGWVEFESKGIAQFLVTILNNSKISNRKKSKFSDSLWSMKYLSCFKWVHLTERLNYEQNNLIKNEFLKKLAKKPKAEKFGNAAKKMKMTTTQSE